MTEKRALYGGIALAIAGVPPLLYYQFEPLGLVGLLLMIIGGAIAYGSFQVD